jgi:hypothetical protein
MVGRERDVIAHAEEQRLREELEAYRVQEQGARWAVERLSRLVERAHFLGRPARAARLREEGVRQLALAAKAEKGWEDTWLRLAEIARERVKE